MKRTISMLLAVLMVFSIVPAQAFATEDMAHEHHENHLNCSYAEDEVTYEYTQNQITCTYANTQRVIPDINETEYTSVDDAALKLRKALKLHTAKITLYVQTNEYVQDTFWYSVFLKAVEHTGDPTEGDYLRYHVSQLTATSEPYYVDNVVYVTLSYSVQYVSSYEQEIELNTVFDSVMNQLNLKDKSQYKKIQDIYGYITANIRYDDLHKYDETYPLKRSAYAALVNGTCVCQGYANLFYRMALSAGIDCRIITGVGNGENHAWNIVCLEGKYYNLDCTWDAALDQACVPYQYFLKGETGFPNHTRDVEYTSELFHTEYPTSKEDYVADAANNATGLQDGDWTFDVINGRCRITAYTGTDTDLVIPATLSDYPVHTIANGVFQYNSVIQSLTISEGIRWIESEAIIYCENLKSIHYPSTVELYSFGAAGLSAVPYGCDNMETVTVADGNDSLVVCDGVLYSKDMKRLLYLPPADPREVLQVPEGVTAIGSESCRDNSNLTKVILPDTVESIGYWSFIHSVKLEEINIPDKCAFIGQYAFQNTSLKSIHIPAAMKYIAAGAFGARCRLQTITVDAENPVYYMADNALYFRGESGDSLIKYAGASDQTNCTIPEGVTNIEIYAFESATNLKQVELPATLKRIAYGAFGDCTNLEEITLPQGLEIIDSVAFSGCHKLVSIYIPESVTYIGHFPFSSSYTGLEREIIFEGDIPAEMNLASFFGAWNAIVFYPKGNSTWTEDVMLDYDGKITWMPYCGDISCYQSSVTNLNCDNPIYITYRCSVCGDTYVFEKDAPGHTWSEATCIVAKTCEVCGVTEGDALGHTWNEATCIVAKTCGVCGVTEGDALGHTWNEATCIVAKTCGVCGVTEGDALGHIYDDNLDGTCNICDIHRECVEVRQVTHMFRMYNPNTGEHFYTGSEVEKSNLVEAGWHYEGVGFTFPANTGAPVHRLFHPSTGEHLYTMDDSEKNRLMADGWNYEGIAFNSAYDTEAVQHRLHNPNATVGAYHFTFSEEEINNLIAAGWQYQGIGWYSCWK